MNIREIISSLVWEDIQSQLPYDCCHYARLCAVVSSGLRVGVEIRINDSIDRLISPVCNELRSMMVYDYPVV